MEQQYKTDAEIYAVLEREIIDLTIRPGSSLSENPLCTRFGAPLCKAASGDPVHAGVPDR